MKTGNDVAARVVEAMEKLGVDYMLAGSFYSNLYGIPRSTKDADFVAVLGGSQLAELQRELGSDFEFDEQPSFETVTGTFREKVKVRSVPFEIEIFHLSKDPHVQGDEALDWDYIHHWCETHGTRALLDEIRASIPPID